MSGTLRPPTVPNLQIYTLDTARNKRRPTRKGVDLAGILGGTHGERQRWVGAECGKLWEEVSPSQPTKGLGERRELPQRGRAEPRPEADFGVF